MCKPIVQPQKLHLFTLGRQDNSVILCAFIYEYYEISYDEVGRCDKGDWAGFWSELQKLLDQKVCSSFKIVKLELGLIKKYVNL